MKNVKQIEAAEEHDCHTKWKEWVRLADNVFLSATCSLSRFNCSYTLVAAIASPSDAVNCHGDPQTDNIDRECHQTVPTLHDARSASSIGRLIVLTVLSGSPSTRSFHAALYMTRPII